MERPLGKYEVPKGEPPPRPTPPDVDVIVQGSTRVLKPHEIAEYTDPVSFWIAIGAFGFACFGAGIVAASSYLMIYVTH